MSIKVMTLVWERAPVVGSALLVLLKLADSANDGGMSYPSVSTIAERTRCSEATAHRALRQLAEQGLISIERNAGPHGVNLYRIDVQRLAQLPLIEGYQNDTPSQIDTPVTSDTPGGLNLIRGGVTGDRAGVSPVTPEPSLEPSAKKRQRESSTRVDVDFRQRMYAKHADVGTTAQVDEQIDNALAHTARRKWTDEQRYVQNWLNRWADERARRRPATQAAATSRRSFQHDDWLPQRRAQR